MLLSFWIAFILRLLTFPMSLLNLFNKTGSIVDFSPFNRELDPNEIDESDLPSYNHDDPRMSTVPGLSFRVSDSNNSD
jgi:hypothetical protein